MASKRAADISQRKLKKTIKEEVDADTSLKTIKEEVAKPDFAKEREFEYKLEQIGVHGRPPRHKVEIQPRWSGPVDKKHGYPIDPDARKKAVDQMKLFNSLDLMPVCSSVACKRGQMDK